MGITVTLEEMVARRRRWRDAGRELVWTNGCFDILHAGHVRYLAAARALGGALVVGLNSDASIRALKGPGRPVNPLADRAEVLCALAAVDYVLPFDAPRCDRELAALAPDLFVKAGDYALETLDPAERGAVEAGGGRIVLLEYLPGRSTTRIVEALRDRRPAAPPDRTGCDG